MKPPGRARKLPKRFRDSKSPSPPTKSPPQSTRPAAPAAVESMRGGVSRIQVPPPHDSDSEPDEPAPLIPAWETKVTWGELSDGIKLIVFAQLKKMIGMDDSIDFLQWEGRQHNEFVELLKQEARFYKEEDEKLRRGNAAREELMMNDCEDYDLLQAAWEAEAYKGGLRAPVTSSISAIEIRKAKAFLLEFLCRDESKPEEIKEGEINTLAEAYNLRISNLPTREQIAVICEGLDDFYGTSTGWDDLGLGDITFDGEEVSGVADDKKGRKDKKKGPSGLRKVTSVDDL